MADKYTDFKLTNDKGFYDISIGADGDFEMINGLETSLLMSIFADRRASESEVVDPMLRRGSWLTLFNDGVQQSERGSKLWLLDQAVNSDTTLFQALNYTRECLQWLIDQNYCDKIDVTGFRTDENIVISAKIMKDNLVVSEKVFDLWVATRDEVNQ